MKARFFPASSDEMADQSWHYLYRLATGLRSHGIEIDLPTDDHLDWRWLRSNRSQIAVLHFHWTQHHYRRSTYLASLLAMAKFAIKLVCARAWGYKLIWTLHNLLPHEQPYPRIDYLARWIMSLTAHAVIVHCEQGAHLLKIKFGRQKNVYVTYLGDYVGVFPEAVDHREAQAQLGLPAHSRTLLFLGNIRPYKGLLRLVDAFGQVRAPDLRLIVAGNCGDADLALKLQLAAQDDPRIHLRLGFLPVEQMGIYFGAADFAVLPYENILTSAGVMTALSYGVPVIAPAMGCLPEVITPDCGFLYDPAHDSLQLVLEKILTCEPDTMRQSARARAQYFSWNKMVQQTARVYRWVTDVGQQGGTQ